MMTAAHIVRRRLELWRALRLESSDHTPLEVIRPAEQFAVKCNITYAKFAKNYFYVLGKAARYIFIIMGITPFFSISITA